MKKLKRRLSNALRSSYHRENDIVFDQIKPIDPSTKKQLLNGKGKHPDPKGLRLSGSLCQLADRLTTECSILEEENCIPNGAVGIYRRRGSKNYYYCQPIQDKTRYIPDRPNLNKQQRPMSYIDHTYTNYDPSIIIQSRAERKKESKAKRKSFTEHFVDSFKLNGKPIFGYRNKAVVHETNGLNNDDNFEVSPCSSDQISMSSRHTDKHNDNGQQHHQQQRYIPNVKLRQKNNHKRWSEQDIQKRLSLPVDIKLPQNVVEKLNKTPTLDNPLTRKNRRASLSEIGFGKIETYKKMFDLGEGTYATVYLGESLLTGKPVALKEIRLEHEEGAPCTAIREVSLLRNLKHANVVTLHDIIYTEKLLTLVFEYVEFDLRDYMEEVDTMINMNNVKLFLMQLLRGLAYCHQRRVLHRDLKPQNLLINNNGELKLADFGLARAQSVPTKTYSNEVVTLWYRPPDVLLGSKEYSSHIDMWGVGCILYEMLTRKAMFPGSTTDEQLNLIFQILGPPTAEDAPSLLESPNIMSINLRSMKPPKSLMKLSPRIDSQSSDLLEKFLKYEGKNRISASDAMRHPFLSQFPQEIFTLNDNESIFTLPGVRYVRETFVNPRKFPMVHSSTSMDNFSHTHTHRSHYQKNT